MPVDLQKLRELGFVLPTEAVLSVEEGDWKQGGEHFVCPVNIYTNSGNRRIWLKAFYDSFGGGIETSVSVRLRNAKRIIEAGGHIPKTERYDPGTVAQMHVEGITYGEAEKRLSPYEFEIVKTNLDRELEIYERLGLNYSDHLNNFIITPEMEVYLIDPWFLPK